MDVVGKGRVRQEALYTVSSCTRTIRTRQTTDVHSLAIFTHQGRPVVALIGVTHVGELQGSPSEAVEAEQRGFLKVRGGC